MSVREIKFRAWTGEKMNYGIAPIDSVRYIVFETQSKNAKDIHIKRGEMMQYTGRKDKTGADIYEGDIVEENGKLAVCTWFIESGAYAFVPTELYPCELQKLIAYHAYDTFFGNDIPETYVKTVGNIYENPELLEVNK